MTLSASRGQSKALEVTVLGRARERKDYAASPCLAMCEPAHPGGFVTVTRRGGRWQVSNVENLLWGWQTKRSNQRWNAIRYVIPDPRRAQVFIDDTAPRDARGLKHVGLQRQPLASTLAAMSAFSSARVIGSTSLPSASCPAPIASQKPSGSEMPAASLNSTRTRLSASALP